MKENFNWYILLIKSIKEKSFLSDLEKEIKQFENRNKKTISEKIGKTLKPKSRFFKGMFFIQLELDWELLSFFYKIPWVINFFDHSKDSTVLPSFILEDKVNEIFNLEKEIEKKQEDTPPKEEKKNLDKQTADLEVGDEIIINNGSFSSFRGKIIKVNKRRGSIDVALNRDGKNLLVNEIILEKVPFVDCIKLLSNEEK